jgi:hypothetical protein
MMIDHDAVTVRIHFERFGSARAVTVAVLHYLFQL